jgi:3-methylcrotonyl-CoA carboxylase alpha subunit
MVKNAKVDEKMTAKNTGQSDSESTSIKRIFIANRGEIARRIAQTARKLGIETVALTDKQVPPAFLADVVTKFIHIQEETTQVYLNPELIIQYAKAGGADAVHPGFGFLSENAVFADLVIKSGLTWIGPNPTAITAMASKATAREHAENAEIPCLAGLNGLDLSKNEKKALADLEQFAVKTGFPLLIKAAFGGGGKGMRIVHKKEDLSENARRAAAEAISSFGNGSLIVEKYLSAPRHVEVQVMGDKHGNVAVFGDRDCSLQRRHQKILEEAPAPEIPAHVRAAMHAAAKGLTSAVAYDSAGTVEFLLDETNRSDVKFFFLEMNTRLQVEHTVTEEVFSVDLVEWQIRVAQGEKIPHEFSDLTPRGHSIEVRIYAEDPGTNFFPTPGPVRAFVPAQGRGIRWEVGMDTVDEITTNFDPMISKLVCTAGSRQQALELLAQTLERTLFAGPRNNIQFLIWLARHPRICERPSDTHFIAAHVTDALKCEATEREALQPDVNALMQAIEGRRIVVPGSTTHYYGGVATHANITLSAFAREATPSSSNSFAQGSSYHPQVVTNITTKHMAWSPANPQSVSRYGFGIYEMGQGSSAPFSFVVFQSHDRIEYWLGLKGHNWVVVDERTSSAGSGGTNDRSDGMSAPVPGKVIQVTISVGSSIEAGQVLFVLESMKMQFEVKASKSGSAASVLVKQGDQVTAGQSLGEWVI